MLSAESDLLFARLGPARLSHPEEYAAIMAELEAAGVEIEFRPGAFAYSPATSGPGRLVFDPDGSIAALRHEYRHFLDIRAEGYPGLSHYYRDVERFWHLESRGYMEELRLARHFRDYATGRRLVEQMRNRRRELLGW